MEILNTDKRSGGKREQMIRDLKSIAHRADILFSCKMKSNLDTSESVGSID